MPPGPRIAALLRLIDQAYDKKSWHGTNLRGSLRGLSAQEAAWRPTANRHNIWELAVHAAYWKYSVLRRLRGSERGGFPVKGSNWFLRPEGSPDEKAWKEDLALLARMHRELREAVEGLSDEALDQIPPGSKTRSDDLISGVAFHDIYHAGQIQLLKRLRQEKR
jgi:uncharacterized damage-inducible protein DinB